MRSLPIALAALALLPSCDSLFSGEYSPEYLREDSPLDPPGLAAARKAQRDALVKEGLFAPGSTVEVQQGRVFLLARNPERTPEPSGKMVESAKAKIISCEGLYYFVELDGGERGFLRESDLVQPVELVPTNPMLAGDLFATPISEVAEPLPLDENQTLTTNNNGRTVVLVGKKSERSAEFEERKKEVETGGDSGADSEPPPLPEPSGNGH